MEELDPKLVAQATEQAKRMLRRRMRSLRLALPQSAAAERSRRIVESLTRQVEWQRAEHIGSYWPLLDRAEVDVRALHVVASEQHKRIYYPFMDPTADGFTTGFREVVDVSTLSPRGRGFSEPPPDVPAASALDLIVVPALAASASGHRLGYGMGFYDATLPDFRPPACAVVVVYDFALLAEIPCGDHDVACDLVVTDTRVFRP